MTFLDVAIKIVLCMFIAWCFVYGTAKIVNFITVKRFVKKFTKLKNHYFYGMVGKLTDLQELNIWFDPVYIKTKYPTLSESEIKSIITTLKKKDWSDTLYARGSVSVVIRVPEGCCISFGNNCWVYKEIQSIVKPSTCILDASALENWVIGDEAVLVKTVKHVN